MSSRPPSLPAALKVLEQEIARAEARGAELVRAEVRRVLEDGRRIVRLGDQQIEVIAVAALDEVVADDAE